MDEERQEETQEEPVSDYNESKQMFVEPESEAPNVSFG